MKETGNKSSFNTFTTLWFSSHSAHCLNTAEAREWGKCNSFCTKKGGERRKVNLEGQIEYWTQLGCMSIDFGLVYYTSAFYLLFFSFLAINGRYHFILMYKELFSPLQLHSILLYRCMIIYITSLLFMDIQAVSNLISLQTALS